MTTTLRSKPANKTKTLIRKVIANLTKSEELPNLKKPNIKTSPLTKVRKKD